MWDQESPRTTDRAFPLGDRKWGFISNIPCGPHSDCESQNCPYFFIVYGLWREKITFLLSLSVSVPRGATFLSETLDLVVDERFEVVFLECGLRKKKGKNIGLWGEWSMDDFTTVY